MVLNVTQRVRSALARRSTLTIDTGFVRTALTVGATSMQLNTFNVSISSESSLATALYSVISWQAFGIFTARIFLAWIDANAVQPVAQLVRWTILVVLANGTWRSHWLA